MTVAHQENKPGLDTLKAQMKQVLLSDKEPPVHENEGADYTIGSLSLLANQALPDYEPLPDYPEEQPDPSVRDVEELEGWAGSRTMVIEQGFGSDSFEGRYRNHAGASTALSGIEATGFHGGVFAPTPVAKKKGDDYDLEAFYQDTSSEEDEEETSEEEEEESSDVDEYETSSDEEDEEEEDEEESSEEEEEKEEESEDEESISGHNVRRPIRSTK